MSKFICIVAAHHVDFTANFKECGEQEESSKVFKIYQLGVSTTKYIVITKS